MMNRKEWLLYRLDYLQSWHDDIMQRRRAGKLCDRVFAKELAEWDRSAQQTEIAIERMRDEAGCNYWFNVFCQENYGQERISDPAVEGVMG